MQISNLFFTQHLLHVAHSYVLIYLKGKVSLSTPGWLPRPGSVSWQTQVSRVLLALQACVSMPFIPIL